MKAKDYIIGILVIIGLVVSGLAFFHTSPKLGGYSPVTASGYITQTGVQGVNILSAVTLLPASTIWGGTSGPTIFTASTTLTGNQFCMVGVGIVIQNTSGGTTTINLPNLATVQSTTFQTGGCGPLTPGAFQPQFVFNNTTSSVVINASSGMTFYNTIPTSSINPLATSTSVTIPAGLGLLQVGQDVNTTTLNIWTSFY